MKQVVIKVKIIPIYKPPYKETKRKKPNARLEREIEGFLIGMEIKRHHKYN